MGWKLGIKQNLKDSDKYQFKVSVILSEFDGFSIEVAVSIIYR